MAFQEIYRRQVALLIRVLPFVSREDDLALKGGTAINLFVRSMPRLSVDIDLTYLPVQDRTTSIAGINAAMMRIRFRIIRSLRDARVTVSRTFDKDIVTKLIVRSQDVQVKIEVTPVLRGTVYEPVVSRVARPVEDAFGFAEMKLVSFADLYAGKIVAALDRQHPRDFFDVRGLLENEGVLDHVRRAFLVYVISHNRPMAEILAPTFKNLTHEFERGLTGMTRDPVALVDLEATRAEIFSTMVADMPADHRRFLIDFKRGNPDWDIPGLADARNLPAVRWKQQNLNRLPDARRRELADTLERVFSSSV